MAGAQGPTPVRETAPVPPLPALTGATTSDLRDAVGSTIYSGTSEIQRLIIGRALAEA